MPKRLRNPNSQMHKKREKTEMENEMGSCYRIADRHSVGQGAEGAIKWQHNTVNGNGVDITQG